MRKEAGADVEKQVRLALALATARKPNTEDVRRGVDLIAKLREMDGVNSEKGLTYFCLLVLNLNEFVYVD